MESLSCLVGREGYQLSCRMPCGIDATRDGIISFQIDSRHFTIINDNGTGISQTHMEEHVVGFIVLIAVAVDTLANFVVIHGNLVVEDLSLFKRGKVALGNLHEGPCHIRWFNESIRQVFVNWIFGYTYFKRIERQPLALFLSPNLYLDTLVLRDIEHSMPFLLGNLHLYPITVCLLLTIRRSETCHACIILVSWKHEIEWCNITRHRNITIIREDGWQTLGRLG